MSAPANPTVDAPPPGYHLQETESGFSRLIGPLYQKVAEPQGQTLGFRVRPQHLNNSGNLHGGMLNGLADMAWGRVISWQRSINWVTVRLVCDFLDSAREGDWVEGGGDLVAEDGGLFTVRGRIWAGDRTLMVGTGLYKGFSAREPRPGERAYRG